MTMATNEQPLRREAIRRRLQGQRRCDICRDLNRATSWFDKWWFFVTFRDRSREPNLAIRPRRICTLCQKIAPRKVTKNR